MSEETQQQSGEPVGAESLDLRDQIRALFEQYGEAPTAPDYSYRWQETGGGRIHQLVDAIVELVDQRVAQAEARHQVERLRREVEFGAELRGINERLDGLIAEGKRAR